MASSLFGGNAPQQQNGNNGMNKRIFDALMATSPEWRGFIGNHQGTPMQIAQQIAGEHGIDLNQLASGLPRRQ